MRGAGAGRFGQPNEGSAAQVHKQGSAWPRHPQQRTGDGRSPKSAAASGPLRLGFSRWNVESGWARVHEALAGSVALGDATESRLHNAAGLYSMLLEEQLSSARRLGSLVGLMFWDLIRPDVKSLASPGMWSFALGPALPAAVPDSDVELSRFACRG